MAQLGAAQATALDMDKAMQTKQGIEFFLKRSLNTYEPMAQLTQVVAGSMHFFKIHVGDDESGPYIWVKAFEPLPCNLGPGEDPFQIQGLEKNKDKAAELSFF